MTLENKVEDGGGGGGGKNDFDLPKETFGENFEFDNKFKLQRLTRTFAKLKLKL